MCIYTYIQVGGQYLLSVYKPVCGRTTKMYYTQFFYQWSWNLVGDDFKNAHEILRIVPSMNKELNEYLWNKLMHKTVYLQSNIYCTVS